MKIIIASFILLFTSCLTTEQPLVPNESMVRENKVQGNWISQEGTFHITNAATFGLVEKLSLAKDSTKDEEDKLILEKGYIVSFQKSGATHYLLLKLMYIDKELYGDLSPLTTEKGDTPDMGEGYLPAHSIVKISFTNKEQLQIQFANAEFIEQQLLDGKMRLKYEHDPLFGTFVITASTHDLQQFVKKYSHTALFNGKEVVLSKKS